MKTLENSRFNQLRGYKVLIVSNESSFNLFLTLMVKSLSARECTIIGNTVLASQHLRKTKFDLVFLDENCFPLSASAFTKYLRFNHKNPNFETPVVIMVQEKNEGLFQEVTHKFYAQNLLFKPFHTQDLNDIVKSCRNTPVKSATTEILHKNDSH